MKCEICGTEMLPLLTSCYCPNEENHQKHHAFEIRFTKIVFPLIANEIVKVQPMTIPPGILFHLDYSFATTRSLGPDLERTNDLTPKYSVKAVKSDYCGIVRLEDVD